MNHPLKSKLILAFLFSLLTSQMFAKPKQDNLEVFSYCSNGTCRLITGEFFHQARGMPVDLHVSCKKNNQYALTFDDGPSANYLRLLEVLKRHEVKATFFVIGNNIQREEAKSWFRQAFFAGHFMANHTFNHDDLTQLSEQAIVDTIEKTRTAMFDAIHTDKTIDIQDEDKARLEFSSKVVRPPFGNINMSVDHILKSHGYTSVRWNADRYDWDMPSNDANTTKTILQRLEQQLDFINRNSDKGVLFNHSILDLNHDWQSRTIDAIESLIMLVKANGYEFVTLDACFGNSV